MVYKLEKKFNHEEKLIIKECCGNDETFILKFINCMCYVDEFNKKHIYNESDSFCDNNSYSNDTTYNLVTPSRIIEFRHHYLVEIEGQNCKWYSADRLENGNLLLWSWTDGLQDAILMA